MLDQHALQRDPAAQRPNDSRRSSVAASTVSVPRICRAPCSSLYSRVEVRCIPTLLIKSPLRENRVRLARLFFVLFAMITVSSILFHFIMLYEGREFSYISGVYWTLTVMSTLGFGDITFQSDLGRLFSIVVLVCGIVMLLVVMPFVIRSLRT